MLLALSDDFADTLELDTKHTVTCDFSMSMAVMAECPAEGEPLYRLIHRKLPTLWQELVRQVSDNRWIQEVMTGGKALNFGLILVTNEEIQGLNRDFRDKDSATDVLTFTLLDDAQEDLGMACLPELSLGEVYISLPWAKDAVCKQMEEISEQKLNFSEGLTLFILERLVHGCLHLLGVHHNTMSDYNKVVAIQRMVINGLTE